MKNLVYLLLFLLACGPTTQPQPTGNVFAKQIGLQDIDSTSWWTYQTVVYFSGGDSTTYMQTHTVVDTATINGKNAYKIKVDSPFGSYNYKMRTDSSGTTVEYAGSISHYLYPSIDTFSLNSCGALSVIIDFDSTVTVGNSYANTTVYHTWQQPCSNADTYMFYQYGIGLVATTSVTQSQVMKQYLVSYQ